MDNFVATILSDAGAGTSPEKVRGILAAAAAIEPNDEETAQLLSLFAMVRATGIIDRAIPDDAEQLDGLLLRGAELFLQLRSDHYAPLFIASIDAIADGAHVGADAVEAVADNGTDGHAA